MFSKIIPAIAGKYSERVAVYECKKSYDYRFLENKSNQIANYLMEHKSINIGIIIDLSSELIFSVLGTLKTNKLLTYISPSLSSQEIMLIIKRENIDLVMSTKKHLRLLNDLQWQCESLETYLCLDTLDVLREKEGTNQLSSKELWNYISENGKNEIEVGGWVSSYTRDLFSSEEMQEYADNIKRKIDSLINRESKVLEIGCASGLTLFRIAPLVKKYIGTDISINTLIKTTENVNANRLYNVTLQNFSACQIDLLNEDDFDLVILNSVVHLFDGLNYLRQVIKKAIDLMHVKGYIFLGDILNLGLKEDFIKSLTKFKQNNPDRNTKLDFSNELFVSKDFFRDLKYIFPQIKEVDITSKIYSIENELTKYRYDVLLTVNKEYGGELYKPIKYQHDLSLLEKCSEKRGFDIQDGINYFKVYEDNPYCPEICEYKDITQRIINRDYNNMNLIEGLVSSLLSLKIVIV